MTHPLTEARAAGLHRYFTGQPCKHGHIAERLVSNHTCLECVRLLNTNGGVRKRPWTEAEEQRLLEQVLPSRRRAGQQPTVKPRLEHVAREIGRSYFACRSKLMELTRGRK